MYIFFGRAKKRDRSNFFFLYFLNDLTIWFRKQKINDAQYNKKSVRKDVNEHKTQEGNTLNEIFFVIFSIIHEEYYALDLGVLGHFISWQSRKRKTQLQKNFRCSIISIHSTFSSLLQCNKFMEYVFLVVLINFFLLILIVLSVTQNHVMACLATSKQQWIVTSHSVPLNWAKKRNTKENGIETLSRE